MNPKTDDQFGKQSSEGSERLKVAFQGERGAYSEEAIIQHFGDTAEPVPKTHLSDVFDTVEDGEAYFGLVPIETTIEGSVVRTYDLMLERTLQVNGEVILRVIHCLIANSGVSIDMVKKVYSHPKALGECRAYLEEHGFEAVSEYDTAGSVKMLKENGLMDSAAIASRRAAQVYGMTVLAQGIETHAENYTRFMIIGSDDHAPTGNDKTLLALIIENKPGTLFESLKVLDERDINLTKIESRPQLGKPWEYVFILELEGHRENPKMCLAIKELESRTKLFKLLGSYPQDPRKSS